jgi:DNA-binding NarL/FixJ family response regulator
MDLEGRIRILSVDDNALLREGIAAIIETQRDMVLVSQAINGADAIRQFRDLRPDVTLMDLRLPDLSGIDATRAIRAEFPDARVIVLTTFEDDVESRRAREAGASDYLVKSLPPDELMQAIRSVHARADGSPRRR